MPPRRKGVICSGRRSAAIIPHLPLFASCQTGEFFAQFRRMKSQSGKPAVGILMGSDSDWPVMKAAADALAEFGIASEAKVISAHRDPHGLEEYAGSAARRGLRVIIAGAGGAAHLP